MQNEYLVLEDYTKNCPKTVKKIAKKQKGSQI